MTSDTYHLNSRIRLEFMLAIFDGAKTTEFRNPTKYWNVRCLKAQKSLTAGKDVIMVLLNGRRSLHVRVIACGLVKVGPQFWDRFQSLGYVDGNVSEVWAIMLGEVLSDNGVSDSG